MRVFVYEHITGGGLIGEPLPASLAGEGELMLQALVHDLMDIPSTEVLTTRDPRLAPLPPRLRTVAPEGGEEVSGLFRRCCEMADAVWPIAPESAGTLERLSRMVMESGRVLLGSEPEAIHIAASKFATARVLGQAGLPVVPTYRDFAELPAAVQSVVIKPDDGAGCMDTFLMEREWARAWWAGHDHENCVVQPYVTGEARSLSLLCRDGRAQLLSCNRQHVVVRNGEFRFTGVGVNEVQDDRDVCTQIADGVAAAIPGLWGYVGVDLAQTAAGPVVLEVNPRLTTSYVGLRGALHCNPAALVLALLDREHEPTGLSCAANSVAIETEHAT